jgi:hypothetical protein
MKGLEIAKKFYVSWGEPYLEYSFPNLAKRVAVGRIFGSDVIEADDEISKDHNWGPQFTVFLSAEDYAKYGANLSEVMNSEAPNPWREFRLAGAGDKSVIVESIPNWIETYIGFTRKPNRSEDWNIIVKDRMEGGTNKARESILYFLRHGIIWFDGSGEMSNWRKSLKYYPESIWYARLAEEIFRVWQHGEYNFVQRVAKRKDPLAMSVCIGEFIIGVMRTLLLLNHDFSPYWKWLSHEFRKLEEASKYVPLLEEILSDCSIEIQVELVLKISDQIHQKMLNSGIITGENDNEYLLPLFNAHNELQAKANNT